MNIMREAPRILLVEDNPDDQDMTRLALNKLARPVDLLIANDGLEALEKLEAMHQISVDELPDLVLVDLSMPRLNGLDLIKAVRKNPSLALLPLIVFTTSTAPADLRNCYLAGCNSYTIKPMDCLLYTSDAADD